MIPVKTLKSSTESLKSFYVMNIVFMRTLFQVLILGDAFCRSHITRKKFEELCKDLWGRSLIPLRQVLTDNSISLEQLHSVELLGGATRVPKLKVRIST